MSQEFEQARDQWVNAYYLGDIQQLKRFEHSQLQIIYANKNHIEPSIGRYEKIAHAVNNGVWKPQKAKIHIEEYEFDRDHLHCKVTLKAEDLQLIAEEQWRFEQHWMLLELKVF